MAKELSNTAKVINWIFNVPYEYHKTKRRWQKQSAFIKILYLLTTILFLGISCFIIFWTGKAFQGLHGRTLEQIVKSILIFIGIILLVIIDVIFVVNMFRQLIFNIIVAFVCRPAKQVKVQQKAVEQTDATLTETTTEENEAETIVSDKENAGESEINNILNKEQKSKTSRGFDTTIGCINILLVGLYVTALIFSFLGGYTGV